MPARMYMSVMKTRIGTDVSGALGHDNVRIMMFTFFIHGYDLLVFGSQRLWFAGGIIVTREDYRTIRPMVSRRAIAYF